MNGSEQQIAASETPRRGRGKPFVKGDVRINRRGVPRESAALAKLLRDAAADVLLSSSPRYEDKARLTCILEALADKAERGDVRAAEVLFERVGGRPTQPEDKQAESGRIVIEWNGPPPPWAPKHMLEDYARKQKALPAAREPEPIEADSEPRESAALTSSKAPPRGTYSPVHPGHIFP